jgi:hypothetical protein
METIGLENVGGSRAGKRTDGRDAPSHNPNIGGGNAIGGGNNPAADQKIETFPHGARQLAQRPALGNRDGPP